MDYRGVNFCYKSIAYSNLSWVGWVIGQLGHVMFIDSKSSLTHPSLTKSNPCLTHDIVDDPKLKLDYD